MGDLGHEPIKEVIKEYYPLARDKVETARLNRQNSQFSNNFGFVINPSIPYHDLLDLCIADFGTGTGIWLQDVAKLVHPSCKLYGFDISCDQFPETHPANMTFLKHDIFEPLPEMVERFDIINVRALCLAIPNAQWDIAVKNLERLLKPGGWVQWIDYDGTPESFFAVDATTERQLFGTSSLQEGIDHFHHWSAMQNRELDECLKLPEVFERCGLEQVHHKVVGTDKDVNQRGECSSTMIVTFDRLLHQFSKDEGSGITFQEVTELVAAMEEEADEYATTGMGNYMRINLIAVVGRKPGGGRTRCVSAH